MIFLGTADPEVITGTEDDDTIDGLGGPDIIYGRGGNDTLNGGDEDYSNYGDAMDGGDGDDVLNGNAGDDRLAGGAGVDVANGGTGSDHLTGSGGGLTERFVGMAFAGSTILHDFYLGSLNDPWIDDFEIDYLYGGDGNDIIWVNPLDVADGGAGTGDRVIGSFLGLLEGLSLDLSIDPQSTLANALGATLSGFELFSVRASRFDDVIIGDAGANEFYGLEGDDTLSGGGGNDTLYGDDDSRLLDVRSDDTLNGGDGNDLLYGGMGADTLDGGDGIDRLYATTNFSLLVEGPDGVWRSSASYFDAGVDTLNGGAGNDILYAGVGDIIDGGDGTDLFNVTLVGLTSGVTLDLRTDAVAAVAAVQGGSITNIEAIGDYVRLSAHDDVFWAHRSGNFYGDDGNDVMHGDASTNWMGGEDGNDVLNGNGGNDRLWGGAGDDTIDGGDGDDTLMGDENNDNALNPAATGSDTIFGGAGNDYIYGGSLDDTLDGGDGVDIIYGDRLSRDDTDQVVQEGNDTISGGAGRDWLYGDGGDDTLDGGLDDDELHGGTGNDTLHGGDGRDFLYGEDGDDLITGGAGDDILEGGLGADRLYGGTGNDTYSVGSQADLIFENAGEGTDTVVAYDSFYLYDHIENLTLLTSSETLFGVGNDLDNVIIGKGGTFLLLGGAGNDTVYGEDGNDSLFGETGDDVLYGGDGIDYLVGGVGADVLLGENGADALYGEDGDDVLWGGYTFDTDILVGGVGNDILRGDSGLADYDLMDGGAGDDLYWVDTGDDLTFEDVGGGTDTVYADVRVENAGVYLYANVENLVLVGTTAFGVGNELDNALIGSENGNYLLGGAGDDVLDGRGGNDVLFGEAGNDVFVFQAGTGGDVIGDFTIGQDRIDLRAFGFANFDQLKVNFSQVGADGAINLANGDFIVLHGVTMADLTAGDFIFPGQASPAEVLDTILAADDARFASPGIRRADVSDDDKPGLSADDIVGGARDAGPQILPGLEDDAFIADFSGGAKVHDGGAQVLPAEIDTLGPQVLPGGPEVVDDLLFSPAHWTFGEGRGHGLYLPDTPGADPVDTPPTHDWAWM